MGPGLASMLVFILLILIWSVYIKRNIGEVAFIGMIVVSLFGGSRAAELLLGGIKYALSYEVLFASLAFVFMSFLLQSTSVLQGMLKIFNRLFRKMKGGPAYVNTAISSFLGMLSGGNTQRRHVRSIYGTVALIDRLEKRAGRHADSSQRRPGSRFPA